MDYSVQTTQMSTGSLIFELVICIVIIVAEWKIYTKAGVPGWACLIPFYGAYKLFEIAGMNGWMFLLCFIPIVNIIIVIKLMIDLAKAFGKGVGFGLGLIFLNPIFMCILGFGSDQYVGNNN